MSELRLILLITAVLAVASLYAWEMLKVRRARKYRGRPKRGAGASDIGPGPADQGRVDYLQTLAELSELAGAGLETGVPPEIEPLGPAREVPAPDGEQPPDRPDSGAEPVITLHVTATPGNSFHGKSIVRAAGYAGMQHGAMNIFHCYSVQSDPGSEILFSLSNMFEPGTLAPDLRRGFQTTGVTLFRRLLPSRDNVRIFDLMLDAAGRLADELHGQVRGPGRLDMTDARLAALRNKVAAYR